MKSLILARPSLQRRFPSGAALALLSTTALAVLGGCLTDGDIGRGTTDETNTARIVGPGGSSAPGAVVRVFAIGDSTRRPLVFDTTDQEGRYSLDGLPAGEYNLLATSRDGSLALYRDSILLEAGAARTDTLGRPGSLHGCVELQPGHNVRTVTVGALGTNIWMNVDTQGCFTFAKIAGGEYTLRAKTTLADYTETFLEVEAFDDSAVVLPSPIEMIYTGIPMVRDLKATYDTAGGTVSLSWRADPGLMDYVVFRDPAGTLEFSAVPIAATMSARFMDTVFTVGGIMIGDLRERQENLFPEAGGIYRVCGRLPSGILGACASIAVTPAPIYESRQSGMRWTRIGDRSFLSSNDLWRSQGGASVQVLRDSLWVFLSSPSVPSEEGGSTWKISAWKSGDGASWEMVSDSLPVLAWAGGVSVWGGLPGDPTPRIFNDSIWAFQLMGDTLVVTSSRDGVDWRISRLPNGVRAVASPTGPMFPNWPRLLTIPSGLSLSFDLRVFVGSTETESRVRDVSGNWLAMDPSLNSPVEQATTTNPLQPMATRNTVWKIMHHPMFAEYWISKYPSIGSQGDAPQIRSPIAMSNKGGAEFGDVLYMPSAVPGTLFAIRNSLAGNWWYVDFPGGRCISMIPWRDKILAIGTEGIWLGEPTPAP